jgi:hypothetical protein
MPMKRTTTTRDLLRRALAPTVALAALWALGGCEINKPEMPTFDTTVTLPLGVERLDVLDAVDGEDYLQLADDGGLLFSLEGDPVSLDLDYDLALAVESQSVAQELGSFALPAPAPLAFGFRLGDIWSDADIFDGMALPVPAFPIATTSGDQDLPDVESAVLASGAAVVRVDNGLPVPISADSGPDQLELVLEDPVDGRQVALFPFGAIAPGASAEVAADLAGVTLPDRLRVRLSGGSPGSGGQPVTIDADGAISVAAAFSDLVVSSAVAVVEAQSVSTTVVSDLPAEYELTGAEIASGALQVDLFNGLPIPCTANLVWPEVLAPGGAPMSAVVDLAPGASASRTIDFSGCSVTASGAALTALNAVVSVESPGSAGLPVALDATDAVTADITGGDLAFASITGRVPEQTFDLDASEATIDLPDELDGLQLTAATLRLRLDNSTGIDAHCDLTLTGVSAAGQVATLRVFEDIPASYDQAVTVIELDETNSDIVPFLNNLPERVQLTGQVSVGGDGVTGTVRPGDNAQIGWEIMAPVEVIVTGATLHSDPEALDLDADVRERIETHALGARVQLEVLNHLPLAAHVVMVVAADSAALDASPLLQIGPLEVAAAVVDPVTGTVAQSTVSHPRVDLTEADARVFGQPGVVTRVTATLPDNGGQTVRVLSTDYIEVRGIVELDVLVDDEF